MKYVTDENGRKRSVILELKEYQRLMKRLEESEDALDLDEAVHAAEGFTDYQAIREELRREGRLRATQSSARGA